MSYVVVQDVPASWHDYERVSAATIEPAPIGLILHVAGPTDEGCRVIEVWESERAWERFRAEQLAPAIAALGVPTGAQPRIRSLHARHLVLGRDGRHLPNRRALDAVSDPRSGSMGEFIAPDVIGGDAQVEVAPEQTVRTTPTTGPTEPAT